MKQKKFEGFLVGEIQGPYELPEGRRWVRLGKVCEINKNSRNPAKEMPNEEFLYIDITGIESGTGEIKETKKILGKYAPSRARRVTHQGDVIMSTVRPYLKAFAIIPPEHDDQICSTGFAVLTCNSEILSKFLLYALFSDVVIEQCNKMMIGAHYPALNNEQVSEIKIPLPPLPEQKRIVARIEELFSKIDQVKKLRKEASELAKTLMPSALHEVFSKADEEGWKWTRLGEVLKEDKKTINPQNHPAQNFWLVTMDCVESDTGKLLKKIHLYGKGIKSMKYQFNSNHILYGKLRPYLNKVYAVSNEEEGICTTEFVPFIVINAIKNYVACYLRTKQVVNFAMSNLTGTRQPRVDISALLDFQIPLPPLEEQKRIADYLDKIQEKAQALQKFQAKTEKEIEKLRESILSKAFRGEL